MAPPANRRKRNVIEPDEDENDDEKPQVNNTLAKFLFSSPNAKSQQSSPISSPVSTRTQPFRPVASSQQSTVTTASATTSSGFLANRARVGNRMATKSPSTSPEKSRSRAAKRPKLEEKGKSGDLLALFSKQAEKAQGKGNSPAKQVASNGGANEVAAFDDILSDPISDDDDVGEHRASVSSTVGQRAKRRLQDGSNGVHNPSFGAPPSSTAGAGSNPSQMFLKPPKPTKPAASLDDDLRPWYERFAPVNFDELAVHKKKVADVRRWLEEVLAGRMRQRLLLLKGASGTGKTTTLRLLARDMGCELLEWKNPSGALGAAYGLQSASAQFEEFLGKGGKFGQLETDLESDIEPSKSPRKGSAGIVTDQRKIIMIEEFPNTFTRSSSALTSFRGSILRYLAANTPSLATFGRQLSSEPIIPVVMVISETLLTTTSASADSFTAHRLLGPEILRHPGAGVIEFNSIAPTLLQKALELVVLKEARKSGRRRTPGPQVLKRLGDIGDIRSAVSSLEFLCLKGDQDADWGAKVTFTKPKKSAKDGISITKGEQESLELISQREASLGIFHAVGKVVYNKREEHPPPNDTVEILPDYMAHLARPRRSVVSVDTLIDETGTDTHTFISALHENYILSCEPMGPTDEFSALDYINGCIEHLSESDLLCPSWDVFFGGRGFSANMAGRDSGSHILRQDEMTFQVAVRGMLFSLPTTVKRKMAGPGKGSDAFKLFYPTSLKLWRAKEEMEGLVDVWSAKFLKGEGDIPRRDLTDGAGAFRRPSQINGNSGSWISAQAQRQNGNKSFSSAPTSSKPSSEQQQAQNQLDTAAPPLLSLGSAARKEMVLERLPYMAQICRGRKGMFGNTIRTKDLERIVSFQGIGPPADDSTLDDLADDNAASSLGGEAWATDRPSEESSPRKKRVAIRASSTGGAGGAAATGDLGVQSLAGLAERRLVLSDDDIEDD